MEGGREQNFWPGFVDALSNVVLVMIFVVVVFVVTLFYYSQKLTQFRTVKLIDREAQQQEVLPPSSPPKLVGKKKDESSKELSLVQDQGQAKEIADLKIQVASLKSQLAASNYTLVGSTRSDDTTSSKAIQVEKDKPTNVVDVLPGITLDGRADALTLLFDRDGVELGKDATRQLDTNIKRWTERIKSGQGKLVVTGVIGTVSYTEGRRRAYYRAMAVRNYLIDVGVSPSSVVSRVVPGAESTNGDATVLIQYAAKSK